MRGVRGELQVISTAQVNLHNIINMITHYEIIRHLLKSDQGEGQHGHALKFGVTFDASLTGPGGLRGHDCQKVCKTWGIT